MTALAKWRGGKVREITPDGIEQLAEIARAARVHWHAAVMTGRPHEDAQREYLAMTAELKRASGMVGR